MGYEIDFLPVGDGSRGGDAIALRYGNLYGARTEQTVVIIDGGYTDDGEALVEHVRTHFGTDHVDFVISTHPDRDHIRGLSVVLENLSVGTLLMHIPENHDSLVAAASKSINKSALVGEKLAKSLSDADDLLAVAARQGVDVVEPFAGARTPDGALRIMSPGQDYYEELLDQMKGRSLTASSILSSIVTKAKELAFKLVPESLHIEHLSEQSSTSPSNNSSVVVMLTVDSKRLLFTGDAGAEALHKVMDQLESEGFTAGGFAFVQVPHHGSRRNVTPSLLDRLLGPKGQVNAGSAFVSCPPQNPEEKHPAKVVLNAFHRRGYQVHETTHGGKRHKSNAPSRSGWSSATPTPFYAMVELHDD